VFSCWSKAVAIRPAAAAAAQQYQSYEQVWIPNICIDIEVLLFVKGLLVFRMTGGS
jgi:hypothetical protein